MHDDVANKTKEAVNDYWETNQQDSRRAHLGASELGHECARYLWYSYRWATRELHKGHLLRLFDRGHKEEARIFESLTQIGWQIFDRDTQTGKQFSFASASGHIGGSPDAVGIDPWFGRTYIVECKTANMHSFRDLIKQGVKAKFPKHYIQFSIYGWAMQVPNYCYVSVGKNDDAWHVEADTIDYKIAIDAVKRGEDIIQELTPPSKISQSEAYFICISCKHKNVCHKEHVPAISCRSCNNAQIGKERGEWFCGLALDSGAIPVETQRTGCPQYHGMRM